jgi:CRISPR-associated protein Csm2
VDPFSKEKIQQVIQHGGKTLVDVAEKLGPRLHEEKLTTSQIRNVFGTVKVLQIREKFDSHEFVLLKPKLAYAAARAKQRDRKSTGAETLKRVLSWAIDEVGNDEVKFDLFVDFFEAILAYHRAAVDK